MVDLKKTQSEKMACESLEFVKVLVGRAPLFVRIKRTNC
jgi:hypothetical protein